MKYFAAMLSAVFFIAIASTGYSQSLAEIAEKERQRREEITEKPEPITNIQLSEYTGGSVSVLTAIELPEAESETEAAEDAAESAEGEFQVDPDEPVDFMGRPESYWRETMSEARKKVQDLENEENVLVLRQNELHNQFFNMDDGFRRESIQREIQKTYYEQDLTKENLAKAREALEDLEKEARKSGALPGWFD